MEPVSQNFLLATVLRVLSVVYGYWHDLNFVVKYTDVDYAVFSDAAKFVLEEESPYNRDTYRYTPFLAWLLVPNIWLSPLWGKVIFCICDLYVGWMIYKISLANENDKDTSLFCVQLWLYNPLTFAVSSRGNAETILAALVLLFLLLLIKNNKPALILSAIVYGFSVHMKIYPITYSLPIYLFLNANYQNDRSKFSLSDRKETVLDVIFEWILPNFSRVIFVATSIAVFLGCTLMCYYLYGYEFLFETYLYHIVRRDTRHNFSPYFYMIYLTAESQNSSLIGLLAFLPQAVLLIITSIAYYRDLPFCCFLNTFIFVTFNKVCTSQYFLWYLSLLPLIVPRLHMSRSHAARLILAWFLGQGLWLLPAYYLEFEGLNTFTYIWMTGLLFFSINVYILSQIINCYSFRYRAKLKAVRFSSLIGFNHKYSGLTR